MSTKFEEMLATVTEFLRSEANTESVIGKEFKLGEYSCVPVIRIGLGFGGGGGGEVQKSGNGAGAGIGMEPMGFLVSREADIAFIPAKSSRGLNAAIEKVPDLLEHFFQAKKEEEK